MSDAPIDHPRWCSGVCSVRVHAGHPTGYHVSRPRSFGGATMTLTGVPGEPPWVTLTRDAVTWAMPPAEARALLAGLPGLLGSAGL